MMNPVRKFTRDVRSHVRKIWHDSKVYHGIFSNGINVDYRLFARQAKRLVTAIMLLFTLAQSAYSYYTAKVSDDKTNIRVDSTVESVSLGYLNKGEIVKVVEEKYGWCKVLLPQRMHCYVSSKFIRKISDNKVEVMASQLNLRSQPNEESYIVATVSKGTILFVKEWLKKDWIKVRGHPYMCGWVNKAFLGPLEKRHDTELSGIISIFKKRADCKANYSLQSDKGVYLLRIDGMRKQTFLRKKVRIIGRKINEGCSYLAVNKIFTEQ